MPQWVAMPTDQHVHVVVRVRSFPTRDEDMLSDAQSIFIEGRRSDLEPYLYSRRDHSDLGLQRRGTARSAS